jgi:glycosyltransferase involved in cell wall biosynthesis
MRICFVSPEIFAWGYHGGFGFLTRTLGREIVKRGHEVSVVTMRRGDQREVEELDGMTVYGFPAHEGEPHALSAVHSRLDSVEHYRKADADIYHSEAVSYNTFAAQVAMPGRFHVITFQDPYDLKEWGRISQVDQRYRLTPAFRSRLAIENRVLANACRKADSLHAQARFLVEKAKKLFQLRRDPSLLPNPVEVPKRRMKKADAPTVCFLARWDPQKRVELFFRLAERFPDVEFIAMGRSHDPATDAYLRKRYGDIPNLTCTEFVSEEEKSRILERSWALVNTSVREALPISFLEALAHETPILSAENPDGLTCAYGFHVTNGDYIEGLRTLLEDEEWRERGQQGREYVEATHELSRVIDRHIEIYRRLLEGRR